ncbi:MAG: hypothetical protein P8L85_07895 [Rubripirellula sp.]|nr:hypothetical protein [Rubripirellula sp.]
MQETTPDSKITVQCPSGHRLRGDTKLIGKTVKCPKCEVDFTFAEPEPTHPVTESSPSRVDNQEITDTGVMRILNEMGELARVDIEPNVVDSRPCTRCGTSVPENMAVCSYCNCYLGILPSYMQRLSGDRSVEQN